MSLEQLTKSDTPPASSGRRGAALLLPGGLLLGFVMVFVLLFGGRLLPAVEVTVVPVITLRTSSDVDLSAPTAATRKSVAGPSADTPAAPAPTGSLLFQASGWVEPDPYVVYASVLINGIVDEVRVLEGEAVKEGQLLAILVDDDARLDLEEAERRLVSIDRQREAHSAAIPVFEAQMEAARKDLVAQQTRLAELEDTANRLKGLPEGAIPAQDLSQALLQVERQLAVVSGSATAIPRLQAEIDRIGAERKSIEAKRKEAETDLARKQLAFDRTRITAPMDGIVLHLHAAPGKKRMLDMDDPKSAVIVELYDPDHLQARIDVPLTEAAGLRVGQPVRLTTDLLPDSKFGAVVTRIVGEADLQRNTLQAKVRIANPDSRLRPEMLVRAEFFPVSSGSAAPEDTLSAEGAPFAGSSERLTIFAPGEALIDLSGDTASGWIVDGSRARLRELTLGRQQRDGHREIRDGLRPGDRLILPPHDKLKPGKRIKIAKP